MLLGGLSYKTKQFFFVLIKLSIVVGAFYFIYEKLTHNENLDILVFIAFLTENDVFSTKYVCFLLILTLFNWFFEILKWQYLVKAVKHISFKNAFEQSLGALTASLITPNRIGEYGAKAAYYSSHQRKRILLYNLLGNMTQMSVTVLFGLIGMVFFASKYDFDIDYYKVIRFIAILIVVMAISFFGIKQKRFKIRGLPLEKIRQFISQISRRTILVAELLSVIRYLIFSFQFYILLHIFGVDVFYTKAMTVITSMYLLASIIPTIFIFDVVVKGSVAVYLFSIVGVNELTILSIITIMWLLNFVLPSLFGSYYVINFNFSKASKNL
ncbi:hypothetical protein A9Q87_02950 [Flavobacteriales bacterium 34_180_T64]|nr:hypothetical protein A9Q87_02950 [Flavobacteriales bacterium 34_180_T64]